MSNDAEDTEMSSQTSLNGHDDARALIRLIQCSLCSHPLQTPVTLPCGRSLCRACLPPSYARDNISYPDVASRKEGITCPFPECAAHVHSLEDCSVNVVLLKMVESIANEIVLKLNTAVDGERQTYIEELVNWPEHANDTEKPPLDRLEKSQARTLPGGRLVATYTLASMGELRYSSDVKYDDLVEDTDTKAAVDIDVLNSIKEACQKELDCHVCYNLILDPVTTPCGHTFCRKCLGRILDHSTLCPVCRRKLFLPSHLARQASNQCLVDLLDSLCPELIAARAEAVDLDERSAPGGLNTPMFIVAVTFPQMPAILHVFDPPYRLMIRRAVQGDGTFGMIAHNEHGLPQGTLGRTQFMQYGVMVQVEHYQPLSDGRSFLQCRGLYRFKVLAHGVLDGYVLARVEKVEDISLAEEEVLEVAETTMPPTPGHNETTHGHLDRLSTRELLDIGTNFVQRARQASAPWLHSRLFEVYGVPPEDPAIFPYWFACVLPLNDQEKYTLLPKTSVRERLKVTARWVHRIEASRW